MKKTDIIFTGFGMMAGIVITAVAIWNFVPPAPTHTYTANKYGAFLAAQHAIYVNDFDTASRLAAGFQDTDLPIVRSTAILADFLSGKLPDDPTIFNGENGTPTQLVHDAYMIKNGDWGAVYAKHKKDESTLAAPLRIWSGVATGKITETLKFIDALKTTDSWKSFVRGQIYAETGKINQAAEQFAKVGTDFMNINDYLYITAFYNKHQMTDAAAKLRADFTQRPGGMFMLDSDITPNFDDYTGYDRALAFSLVQSVSHTQVMMYSDLSLLLLRFAQIIQNEPTDQSDAINYYLGQYFFNNGGDYKKFYDAIDKDSPFYPFAMMKIAEKTGKIHELERATRAYPLFVPAINKLVAKNVQSGDRRGALRVVNRALDNKNLTSMGRAFFLKSRAQIYLTFGDLDKAQDDIRVAADIAPMDTGILSLQSRIWSAGNRELETAYEYAIALVHKNPADVETWDVLGVAVRAREGNAAALEILERVGQVAGTCSSLFEHLGDLYAEAGNKKQAADAYLRAIDLSDDGLAIIPVLENKLRNLR